MWRSEKAELRGGVKGKGMVVEAWRLRGPGVPRAYGPPVSCRPLSGMALTRSIIAVYVERASPSVPVA
jgi:hypothetical protein